MKNWRHIFTVICLSVVLVGILGVEQVYGLPLVYLGMSSLWLEKKANWIQLIVSVILGSLLATVYTFSYSLGFVVILGCIWGFQLGRERLASQTGALLVAAIGAGVIVGVLSPLTPSWAVVLSSALSVVTLVLVSKITLTQSSKRYHL